MSAGLASGQGSRTWISAVPTLHKRNTANGDSEWEHELLPGTGDTGEYVSSDCAWQTRSCYYHPGTYQAVIMSPDGSKVIVLGRHFRISAHSTIDGAQLWVFENGAGVIRGAGGMAGVPFLGVCDNMSVYVGSSDGYVYALNTVDGSLKWKFYVGGDVGSSPVCSHDGSRVVIGTNLSQVVVLNANTGALIWESMQGQYNWDVRTNSWDGSTYSTMSSPTISQDNRRVHSYGQAFGTSAMLSLKIPIV